MNPFLNPTTLRRAADILAAQPELAKGVYYDARTKCYCTMGALCYVLGARHGLSADHCGTQSEDEITAAREIVRLAKFMPFDDVYKFNDSSVATTSYAATMLRLAADALSPINEADRLQHIEDLCDNAERRQAARDRSADQ